MPGAVLERLMNAAQHPRPGNIGFLTGKLLPGART